MTTGILIIHTDAQLEEASSLVDLLEASLSLPSGAIRCSSLPGYAWPNRNGGQPHPDSFAATLDEIGAAIALVDRAALAEPQLMFDLAAAWARGKRIALLADHAERRRELPPQLSKATLVARLDRAALADLVEDLAFDLGLNPRLGKDAQRALNALSSAPPPPPANATPAPSEAPARVPAPAAAPARVPAPPTRPAAAPIPARTPAVATMPTAASVAASIEDTPLEPAPAVVIAAAMRDDDTFEEAELEPADEAYEPLRSEPPPAAPASVPALDLEDAAADDAVELSDDDVEPLREPAAESNGISCGLSFEAGRAISECSFHRDEGGDFGAQLEASFGRFIDLVGGDWGELRRLSDLDVWLGATDNLLESLPPATKHLSEWYEMGFQFSTLRSIAEQGLPADPEERAIYEELWGQSMSAFLESADSAQIAASEAGELRSSLENLIGPEPQRDYANLARSLQQLRALAEAADRG